ncbi:hypothetical protein MPSEU_000216500 [Mayamaea pseudoterrestris]|nr:hypothetical protein MPSEU_000216500 [Mayamaea pseudoterrestris]
MMTADDEKKSFVPPASDGLTPGTASKKRASSIFRSARQSFFRSGGKRGASADKLRGTKGADFEATGRIQRTSEGIGCGCFGNSMNNSDVLVLVKGPFVFVFASNDSSSPQYAISLSQLQAKANDAAQSRHPVSLETSLGDVQYIVSFEEADIAAKFARVVKEQSALADRAEIKKKLGHDHLVSKRASVKFAEQVANEKVKSAPTKPDVVMDQTDMNYAAGVTTM